MVCCMKEFVYFVIKFSYKMECSMSLELLCVTECNCKEENYVPFIIDYKASTIYNIMEATQRRLDMIINAPSIKARVNCIFHISREGWTLHSF